MARFRLFLVGIAVCVSAVMMSASPASASPAVTEPVSSAGIPAATPALDLLYPTSSTTVHAGQAVHVGFNFVHVPTRPFAKLYYKAPGGNVVSVPLDTTAATVTVPSNWSTGKYRLWKVWTNNGFGAIGEQYRNHDYTGTTYEGQKLYGHSLLKLCPLDIRVV